ncbi:lipase (class 2) domain-containing protein [Ditylenchus destructor]|uniref:Lipase (Class 2) domain-containing protein n=1 Tax=Ditylenchus destructor TaxID=166010 RepID=A0AAD4R3Y7_9BILA|nr:lipase (class 2) domain-containing protein [Ditylenchus destructor]
MTSLLGSFGGMDQNSPPQVNHRPIIFVHGVTLSAAFFHGHRKYLMEKGYSNSELYATTYGKGLLTPLYVDTFKCSYVKMIRQFIIAVSSYTNSKVDIIAYSMGVGVTRKAILGGNCVDTGEYVGSPLTLLVENYVGVAGATYGLEFCPPIFIGCNLLNGLNCMSTYLREVNSQYEKFEGSNTYVIYSKDDQIVGQRCCGRQCSIFPCADKIFQIPLCEHLSAPLCSIGLQYSLVAS